ncbi:elongation factor P [Candidatus Peregrinibacteria bacterium]|nr:elongation factor P [Candidatus Peregrinibacteria bacterium]
MYVLTDLKPGRAIQMDGVPYLIVSSQFGRKSQSKANMQCKLKNLKTGAIVAHNFQGSEKVEPADVGFRRVQFLYKGNGNCTFMDLSSYDQFELNEETIADAKEYLVEGQECDAMVFDDQPIGIQLPSTVNLKIVETIPGVKGDTATGGTKPATLESGLVVNVPLFLSEGTVVKINTETGMYMSKVE